MIKATLADKPLIINILSKAFDSNGSVNYVVKQDKNRAERIGKLMDYSFELCFRFGEVMLTDCKQGVALLLFPPEKENHTQDHFTRCEISKSGYWFQENFKDT